MSRQLETDESDKVEMELAPLRAMYLINVLAAIGWAIGGYWPYNFLAGLGLFTLALLCYTTAKIAEMLQGM